jgi:lysophospholipase L1-like esterase
MKKILAFLLFSTSLVAQDLPNRKVDIGAISTKWDAESIIKTEGKPYLSGFPNTLTLPITATAVTVNPDGTTTFNTAGIAGNVIQAGQILPGKTFFPDEVLITFGDKVSIQSGLFSNSNIPSLPNWNFGIGYFAGLTQLKIPVGGRTAYNPTVTNTAVVKITKPYTYTATPSTVSVDWGVSVSGTIIKGDANFTSPYLIQLWGDSILEGYVQTGLTDTTTIESYIRNYYADKGFSIRIRNMSVSGSTSGQHLYAAQAGEYNNGMIPCVVAIGLGTNDGGNNVSASTVAANVQGLVKRALSLSKFTKVVVIPPPPRNDATVEPRLATIRTAVQSMISALGNSRVSYAAGVGTAWTWSDVSKTSDGTHPNGVGTAAYMTGLKPTLDTIGALPLIPNN